MKLQEQLSRKAKGKKYPKYVMTIPPKHVEELGWKKGIELDVVIQGTKLIIQPKQVENDDKTC